MSEPKFTPGPWKAEKCTCGHECCTKYNINISGANGMFDKDDANLIAAAPKMYAVLERCLRREYNSFEPENQSELYYVIEKLLKEARGETQSNEHNALADAK